MKRTLVLFASILLASCASIAPAPGDGLDNALRLNQIQAIGTHNSYKLQIDPPLMELIKQRNANTALTLDYFHRSIAEQLDAGARQVEIDPLGGYASCSMFIAC